MVLLRLSVCLLVGACASAPQAEVATNETKEAEPPPRTEVDRVLDQAALDRQEHALLFDRSMVLAQALRKDGQLDEALLVVERALLLRPGDAGATRLRDDLRRDLGDRMGSVSVLARDEVDRYAVLMEEERLFVARLLAHAEGNKRNGDWDEARRNYEAALFVLRTSPFREDASYGPLAADARKRAQALADERRAREKARHDTETAAALREIARQEENSR